MMAESLPFPVGNPVPTWDLESWYEDLQEVLSLDVSSGTDPPVVGGQEWEQLEKLQVAFGVRELAVCKDFAQETPGCFTIMWEASLMSLHEKLELTDRSSPCHRRNGTADLLEEFSLDDTALLWDLEALGPLEPSGSPAAGACELSPHLSTELLELLGEEPARAPESDSSHSSPPQTGTDEEEVATGQKRKRSRQPQGGKRQRGREREQQNEHRVTELMAQNECLRKEIERLSAEVEATRAALIQRMVSLKS